MIQIREACQSDAAKVKAIEISCGLSHWSLEDYLSETNRPDNLFFVAVFEQRVIGFVLARLIMYETNNIKNNEIEIYNIAVLKEYRCRSVATELLKTILLKGSENGVRKLFLEVRKSNHTAQNFYLKNAFDVVGERKNFYRNPSEDGLMMCRSVKSI